MPGSALFEGRPAAHVRIVPPFARIAELAMSAQGHISSEQADTLSKAWASRHAGMRSNQLRPVPKISDKGCSPCYFAGNCICKSERGKMLSQVAHYFSEMAK
eukprot:7815956-Pyramimonas_sp.AAC.1